MKRNVLCYLSLALFICTCFTVNLSGQLLYDMELKFTTPLDFPRWDVVDNFNFNQVNNWELSENTVFETGLYAPKVGQKFYQEKKGGVLFNKMRGNRFLSKRYKESEPKCLGFKVYFPEFVREYVLLKPKTNYKLTGKTKKIGFWLLARNNNVDFEVVLQDYRRRMYYLPAGNLNFLGWRYIEVDVPFEIQRKFNQYERFNVADIYGFIVANNPERYSEEAYKPIYFYIDQLEALPDKSLEPYSGSEIKDDW